MYSGTTKLLVTLTVTYLVLGWATYAWSHGSTYEFHSGYHHGDPHKFYQQMSSNGIAPVNRHTGKHSAIARLTMATLAIFIESSSLEMENPATP